MGIYKKTFHYLLFLNCHDSNWVQEYLEIVLGFLFSFLALSELSASLGPFVLLGRVSTRPLWKQKGGGARVFDPMIGLT